MAELPVMITDLASGTFDQKLDHADAASPTFKQRYWYSTQFAKGANAPVIYVICGESECSERAILGRGDVAKTLGAAVIALEHRYYGKSLPFANPKVEDMKYLSIGAALADLDAFETFAKTNLGLGGKWIALGGSYSGMLSAFYREKYPQQVVGAWASSAPVDMQLTWYGSDEVTARALGPDCLKRHQQVMTTASDAFDDPARRDDVFGRLNIHFTLPDGANDASKKAWKRVILQRISSVPRNLAQEDNVRPYCAALAQEADPVDGFGLYTQPPLVPNDNPPPPAPPTTGTPPGASEGVGTNPYTMWNWQTCTEMGFFEVANPNRELSVRSELDDGQAQIAQCTQYWHVTPNVDATRAEYFDPIANGQVTNLFFVNGSLDPWSALSLRDPATAPAGVTEHIVQLATHTQDMQTLTRNSLLGVFEAHKKFHDLAVVWLAEP
jgi:pimeloyl-ACP methyl ester carboxylesterase